MYKLTTKQVNEQFIEFSAMHLTGQWLNSTLFYEY